MPPAPSADVLNGITPPPPTPVAATITTPTAPPILPTIVREGVNSIPNQIASILVNNYSYSNQLSTRTNDQKSIMSTNLKGDNLIDFATVNDLMEDLDVLSLFDPLSTDSTSPNNCSSTSPTTSSSPESTSASTTSNNTSSPCKSTATTATITTTSSATSSTASSTSESESAIAVTSSSCKSKVQVQCGKRITIVKRNSRTCDSLSLFENKLRKLRSKYKFDDHKSNTGLVISPIIETQYHGSLSIKLIIYTTLRESPVTFTCNVNSTIEHIISQVICTIFEDVSSVNFDTYLLKVFDRSEYFASKSSLMDYAYVLECHKFDRDVKLTLVRASDCSRIFARTAQDDVEFEQTMSADVLLPDKIKNSFIKIDYETVSTLIETFDREVDRLLDSLKLDCDSQNVTRHQGVKQAVQAICSVLGRQTSEQLRIHLNDFTNRVESLTGSIKDSPGTTSHTRHRSSQDIELIQVTIEKLYSEVLEMIRLYSETFPVNFTVDLPSDEVTRITEKQNSPVKYSIDCHESFICWIGQVSQPSIDWSTSFRKFCLQIELWHGENKLAAITSEKQYLQAGILKFQQIVFEELITIESVSLAKLPRETCIYFSIIGYEYLDPDSVVNNSTNQESMSLLAMAILKLFDAQGKLLQGPQLLPMWTRNYINNDNRFSINTNCYESDAPILSINLFPTLNQDNIIFPPVGPEANLLLNRRPSSSSSSSANSWVKNEGNSSSHPEFNSAVQSHIYEILHRNPTDELLSDDKVMLWGYRGALRPIPSALPKVLLSYDSVWDYYSLRSLYDMIDSWTTLPPIDAMHLLLPSYPDLYVRKMAVTWLKALGADGLIDFLPQVIQAIRFEPYLDSPLIWYLLESALTNVRVAHSLYWLLKENFDDPLIGFRTGIIANSLMAIVGSGLSEMFENEETFTDKLTHVSQMLKKTKENSRLSSMHARLESVDEYLKELTHGVCLPLSPSAIVSGLNISTCSYFTSHTLPLKLSFKPASDLIESVNTLPASSSPTPFTSTSSTAVSGSSRANETYIETIFKIGDDLRQDTLTMQIIRIMDKLWLKEGLDLKIVTFNCVSTDHRQGFVEMISSAETLRKIQQEQGLAGTFNERSISEWLRKHNTYELNYRSAVENFIHSTAGYIVATYILGVCDRHNDNIMITTSGHLFHIDFGKFLGDVQMLGLIARDRVPFVLTSDMAYVINGGPTENPVIFKYFVGLCCEAFATIRKHSNLFLTLFSLMACSSIPGVTNESIKFVYRALLPHLSTEEATAEFTRKINASLKAKSVQLNFLVHTISQMRFTGDHNDQRLLSFVPNRVTFDENSKINSVSILSYYKKYEPEKHYYFIVKVDRSHQRDPSFVSRTFSEFYEFYSKITTKFPLVPFPNLSSGPPIGRSNTQEATEKRKKSLDKFLKKLMSFSDEITHCDLVYTFFQPLLRDQEFEADPEKAFNRKKNNKVEKIM